LDRKEKIVHYYYLASLTIATAATRNILCGRGEAKVPVPVVFSGLGSDVQQPSQYL
jgi:hypothetical protein